LAHGRQSQGLKRARDRHFTIADVRGKDFAGELFFVEFVTQLQDLDVVKKFDDLLVRAIAEGAQKSRREEFSAALASVEINVKQISRIELHLNPRTAVWNDAKTIKHLAVDVDSGLERNAGRTMQLAHHHAFRTIDDEGTLRCHERDLTHVDFFFLRAFLLSQLECHVQRRTVGLPFALRFKWRQFWFTDIVVAKIKNGFFIVAFDRENFLENSLKPLILALRILDVFLKKIDV